MSANTSEKRIWLIVGPPGAGKSGLARSLFPGWAGTSRLIDADDAYAFAPGEDLSDDLLQGLGARTVPFSKRFEIAELAGREFVIETRLVNREPLSAALKLSRRGWQVFMIYLALPRLDLCRARVRARVARGGADVSDEALEIGFRAALDHLPQYIDLAARWLLIDSSGARSPLIARGAHAAAIAEQPDVLRALLPGYPFLPAGRTLEAETWTGPVIHAFSHLARWQSSVDHLLRVAEDMESAQS